MADDLGKLLLEALGLPPEARVSLAHSLLESVDAVVDEQAEEEWRYEIRKRIQEVNSGKTLLVPWEEIRTRLLANNGS